MFYYQFFYICVVRTPIDINAVSWFWNGSQNSIALAAVLDQGVLPQVGLRNLWVIFVNTGNLSFLLLLRWVIFITVGNLSFLLILQCVIIITVGNLSFLLSLQWVKFFTVGNLSFLLILQWVIFITTANPPAHLFHCRQLKSYTCDNFKMINLLYPCLHSLIVLMSNDRLKHIFHQLC